jgi:neutral amino acid transport system ATP-binding protein
MTSDPVLIVDDLARSFDGLQAVAGASFAVERGSITALIGPNGAGKTTTFDLLSRTVRPDRGMVTFESRSLAGLPPHAVARLGMVRTFQLTRVLAGMSVMDNMLLAAPHQPGEQLFGLLARPGQVKRKESQIRERAGDLLRVFGLLVKAADYAGDLSGGQRKLLELARALMTEPTLVLLDEPMAGVNPILGRQIFDHVEALRRERGTTFLFVEHDMDVVMSRADRVIVMGQGRVIATGTPSEIRVDARVIDAYLGDAVELA